MVAHAVTTLDPRRTGAGPQGGYVLLTVLLLSILMVSGTVGYARYALQAEQHDVAALGNHSAREAALSGLAYARQALASGTLASSTTVQVGGAAVDILLTDAGNDRHLLTIESLDEGLGARIVAEAAVIPSASGDMPRIDPVAAAAILADSATQKEEGTKEDKTFEGHLVVKKGKTLNLINVVVKGSIFSETALLAAIDGLPYDDIEYTGDETALVIEGGLRVDGVGAMAGVSIFMPEGSVSADDETQIELNGAVVSNTLLLDGHGVIAGPLLTQNTPTVNSLIDRPGEGRAPRPWPTALTHASYEIDWIAFPDQDVTAAEKAALAGFLFPAKLGAAVVAQSVSPPNP